MADTNSELQEYEYGVSSTGVGSLIANIRLHALTNAAGYAISDDGKNVIKGAARQYWTGTAEQEFEKMLDLDAQRFSDNVTALVNAAIAEINNAGLEYEKFDDHLMDNLGIN
jgi:hypothetical protein